LTAPTASVPIANAAATIGRTRCRGSLPSWTCCRRSLPGGTRILVSPVSACIVSGTISGSFISRAPIANAGITVRWRGICRCAVAWRPCVSVAPAVWSPGIVGVGIIVAGIVSVGIVISSIVTAIISEAASPVPRRPIRCAIIAHAIISGL